LNSSGLALFCYIVNI